MIWIRGNLIGQRRRFVVANYRFKLGPFRQILQFKLYFLRYKKPR